ncbi:SSI family serine proteinase inhibitor [Arthrobacter sp. 35/47]|uniref:SSI family serine proteinase inhibitor n=1 Tax=Arthrobacter sp. 35/47 TaxID=269454 RepID=UPI0004B72EEC|nr:SSI family serine proteinase inhibitor [Arthrobacter sp. 35/47]
METARSVAVRGACLLTGSVLTVLLAGCGATGNPGTELTAAPPSSPSSQPAVPSPTPTASESSMSTDSPKPAPSLPSDPAAVGSSMLTISIRQNPEAEPVEYFLECTPDGIGETTTLPNPAAACEAVKRLGAAFFNAEPDPNQMCTQQYGGPQTATIKGTVDGHRVYASFSATDGCEIARWNAVESILGPAGAN